MTEALKTDSFAELYQQLQRLPDHLTGQIIAGELVVSPRPTIPHANAETDIAADLRVRFGRRSGGSGFPGGWLILIEPELHLGDDVLVPDIAGWKRETLPHLPRAANIDVTPDWVCEVLSPRTAKQDRNQKARCYHRAGVTWRWLIDPELQTLEIYRREGDFWTLIGIYEGDSVVRAAPFDAVELDMSPWWEGFAPETGAPQPK